MATPQLDAIARDCRVQIIRMLTHAGSGHPGGSLSVIDMLVIALLRPHAPRSRSGPTGRIATASCSPRATRCPRSTPCMAKAGYFPEEPL